MIEEICNNLKFSMVAVGDLLYDHVDQLLMAIAGAG